MTTLSLRKAYPFSGESITSICMHCSNIFGVLWTQEAFDLFDQNYLGWGKRISSIRGWWLEIAVSDRAAVKLSPSSSLHVPSSHRRKKNRLFCNSSVS